MDPLELVKLTALMERTLGKPEVVIGLIDGPVVTDHESLSSVVIRKASNTSDGECSRVDSFACQHGTFVAGILSAQRGSPAPAICPNCTLFVRPIFAESSSALDMPTAQPEELADGIVDSINAGARVLNISAAIQQPSLKSERVLEDALNHAAKRDVIVVAAAGNQGTVGSTAITRHPWVIPVVACNASGRPLNHSNLGHSIGRKGLGAPGEHITSLAPGNRVVTSGGTSVATPFVTGAIALLWSEIPGVSGAAMRLAVTQGYASRRTSVVPPLLDAWSAYQNLRSSSAGRWLS
jgi:subtilisin family serine protease